MKRLFKNKIAAILLTTIFLSSNTYAWEWKEVGQKFSNAWNSTQRFFNADTNPILNNKNNIESIPNSNELFENLKKQTSILKKDQKILKSWINKIKKNNKIINLSNNIKQLEKINECIELQKNEINNFKNFINDKKNFMPNFITKLENTKAYEYPSKKKFFRWFKYPKLDSINEEGVNPKNLDYLHELTKKQKNIYMETEKCLKNTGDSNILYKEEMKNLLAPKETTNEEYKNIRNLKIKYHIRELLKTITPDNPYLKWALITALTVGSIETLYAFMYGVIKGDLRKGIKNTFKFNWNVLKFLPYTMPKWTYKHLFKPALAKAFGRYYGADGRNFAQAQAQGVGIVFNRNPNQPVENQEE